MSASLPIIRVADTFAHPCGCVAEGDPERVTEACGKRTCPNWPLRRGEEKLLPVGLRVRGR